MLCKDCSYFHIMDEPVKDADFGHAVCYKHNLITDFIDRRKIKRLECVEQCGESPKEERT